MMGPRWWGVERTGQGVARREARGAARVRQGPGTLSMMLVRGPLNATCGACSDSPRTSNRTCGARGSRWRVANGEGKARGARLRIGRLRSHATKKLGGVPLRGRRNLQSRGCGCERVQRARGELRQALQTLHTKAAHLRLLFEKGDELCEHCAQLLSRRVSCSGQQGGRLHARLHALQRRMHRRRRRLQLLKLHRLHRQRQQHRRLGQRQRLLDAARREAEQRGSVAGAVAGPRHRREAREARAAEQGLGSKAAARTRSSAAEGRRRKASLRTHHKRSVVDEARRVLGASMTDLAREESGHERAWPRDECSRSDPKPMKTDSNSSFEKEASHPAARPKRSMSATRSGTEEPRGISRPSSKHQRAFLSLLVDDEPDDELDRAFSRHSFVHAPSRVFATKTP